MLQAECEENPTGLTNTVRQAYHYSMIGNTSHTTGIKMFLLILFALLDCTQHSHTGMFTDSKKGIAFRHVCLTTANM